MPPAQPADMGGHIWTFPTPVGSGGLRWAPAYTVAQEKQQQKDEDENMNVNMDFPNHQFFPLLGDDVLFAQPELIICEDVTQMC